VIRVRVAVLSVVVAAAAAACGGSGSPTTSPSSAAPSAAALTAAPSISPVASPVAVLAAKVTAPTLSLYEWKVIAAPDMRAGKTTFTISNFGTVPHELLIFKSNLPARRVPSR
jgi:hypothetical protein